MKKTALYEEHVKSGATIVEFAGWLMPLQYSTINEEVLAVRHKAGLFDVSHMGEIEITGPDTFKFVDYIVTNFYGSLEMGQIMYTAMCNEEGGVIDDLLVYSFGKNKALLVVNAANTEKDFKWIHQNAKKFDVEVENVSSQYAQLALQGPISEEILQRFVSKDLSAVGYYHFIECEVLGAKSLVSRTGYTGEDGFEIYCDPEAVASIWRELIKAEVKPAGLGARDVCRLEASYMLYGNDMDETTTPLEAGLSWVVRLDKDFIGRDALAKQKERGIKRRIRGLELSSKRIARHGMLVYMGEDQIGEVTSGTLSPTIQKSIAMARLKSNVKISSEVSIDIRGRLENARVVKLPFYKGSVKRS